MALAPFLVVAQVPIGCYLQDWVEVLEGRRAVFRKKFQVTALPPELPLIFSRFLQVWARMQLQMLRARLLFDYPQSFQAGFLYTTFEDAEDFRNFLNERTEQQFEKNPAELPEKILPSLQRWSHALQGQ